MKNIKIGTKVSLNSGEQMIAVHIAESRRKANKNSQKNKHRTYPEEAIELEGVAGELAFCKLFNVMPDMSVGARSAIDKTDKGDALVENTTVDVKTTRKRDTKLIVGQNKKYNDVELYALMLGEFPNYTFLGFTSKKFLMQDINLRDGKYTLYPHELKTLKNFLR